jgi:glycosyltransferase involved in cell wall biosynthesis
VHTGWGEALFLKEIFPKAKIVGYFEFFYRAKGADVGFDPEFDQHDLDDILRIKIRNSHHLLSYECCDSGITPTLWQHELLPEAYRHKVKVIHEGVDTELVKPNQKATFRVNDELTLSADNQVITFVNRNLEPYRGFHIFMRALPKILSQCPNANIVLVGGNDVSYGRKPVNGENWKSVMLDEIGSQLDLSRIHFVGNLQYERYLSLLQISSAHVYLTYPFVLSWSMLEAMAIGCIVIGSNTSPVKEVISHEVNGLLVDFFDNETIAATVIDVIHNQSKYKFLRDNARQTIIDKYDLSNICLPNWLNELVY